MYTDPRAAIQVILENGTLQTEDLSHKFKLTLNPAKGAGETRALGGQHGQFR